MPVRHGGTVSRSRVVLAAMSGDVTFSIEEHELRLRSRAERLQTLGVILVVGSLVLAYQGVRDGARMWRIVDRLWARKRPRK
jgi:hypothetical protein